MQLLMDGTVHTRAQLRDLGWLRGESSQWGGRHRRLPSVGMKHWWEVRGEPLSLRASAWAGGWTTGWIQPARAGILDPGSALTSFVLLCKLAIFICLLLYL